MIGTYSELVTAIGNWLDRDDLAARAPEFIQLAEARLNRLLRDPEMQVVVDMTATSDYTSLPADFGRMVSINTGQGYIYPTSPVEFAGYNTSIVGIPRHYVIVDGSIGFAPANSTALIHMVYERRLPALTDANTTNWLLTLAPDVYLYGALVQAEAFLNDDSRVSAWKGAFDEAIAELRADGDDRKWGAGALRPRINRR